jgi:D-inositol-3-phosphate glycosyltransferase
MKKTLNERLNGLRWRLQAMRRLWGAGAEPDMTFLAPEPPEAGAIGKIDYPPVEHEIDGKTLTVSGWVAFTDGPVGRVEAWLDDELLGRARLGLPRTDLNERDDIAYGPVAGFELLADIADVPRPTTGKVRVVATGGDGRRHELGPVPISLVEPGPTPSRRTPPRPLSPDPASGEGGGLRTMVVTHQLNLGGAQLYLMDLLRGLHRNKTIEPIVISALDGPLRRELEAMGIPVHITSVSPLDTLSSHLGRVEEMAAWTRPFGFELALVNTATSLVLPGAEVAGRLGIPAVWAIHESFEPAVLWAGLDPDVRERAEAALSEAAFAIFEAEATQRIFEPLVGDRGRTLPYGLDLAPIDAKRASFDPALARRQAGLPKDGKVIVCIGTIEPRKAQIPLAQAFERIAAHHPDAHVVFVGGREEDPYCAMLEKAIEASAHHNQMRVVPVTPDIEPWYGMADLLVCASDVESLPRTVLEAMAWETPVLATDVFGLPELITEGETGWLCPSRDVPELAAELDRALSAPVQQSARIAAAARELVAGRHDLDNYARQVGKLFEQAVRERTVKSDVAAD